MKQVYPESSVYSLLLGFVSIQQGTPFFHSCRTPELNIAHARSLQSDLAVAESAPEHDSPGVIVGTEQGIYLLNSHPQIKLKGNSITALATRATPNSCGTVAIELWAIANHQTVWHYSPEGGWSVMAESNHRLNCLLPIDNSVLVGTAEAHLLQIKSGHIQPLEGFDQAEGREDWYTPWGGAPDVRSLAISSAGDWYANIHVGGILRSRDQGRSWQPTIDFHADVHEVRTVEDAPNLVLAATAKGFAWSEDYGESWQFDHAHLHATYARAIALCNTPEGPVILMSASLGPRGDKAALYRRLLHQPGTFQKCHQGLPEWFADNINTGCLASWKQWVVFGTRTGQIFRSNDAGLSWEEIASGLAPIHWVATGR